MVGHLATGGMAEIFLAKLLGPAGFQRPVVLKRVLPHLTRREEFRHMFLDEARIVAGIRHPNVVQVHELGLDKDELFLVMEYLEGESISGLMRRLANRRERLDYALAAYVVAEACAGLHAAHEYTDDSGIAQNLVHRDVSPQNIFIGYDGSVKVLDFGIAKAADRYSNTSTGQMKGKFSYMAPEQCRAEELDRRADLFALGIVLYEMSTGKRLFLRENQLLVLKAITEEAIPPPSQIRSDYPPQLEHVVMMALARDRIDRYSTAAEMRRELLAAVRALDPSGMPEERLSDLMREVFADRISEKAEMLKQVRAGTAQIHVPAAEIDDSETGEKRVPIPMHELPSPGTLASQETAVPIRAQRNRKRNVFLFAGTGLIALVALVLFLLDGEEPEDAMRAVAQAPAATAAGASPAIDEPVADDEAEGGEGETTTERETPPPPEAREVQVRIVTSPPGATVTIGGRSRGVTPIELTLPRGDDALTASLTLDGYEPQEERIVPDVDQRLRLTLRREEVAQQRPRRRWVAPRPTETAMEPTMEAPPPTPMEEPTPMRGGESFFRFD